MPAKTILIMAVIFLTACANTFSNPTSITNLKPNSDSKDDRATIIFSTGAPKGCLGTGLDLQLFFDWETNNGKSEIFSLKYYLSNYNAKSDFQSHHGFIHAAKISPGKYYFFPTSVGSITSGYEAHFSVEPNETVYLGEYFIEDVCKLNVRATWTTEVKDQSTRDIAKIKMLNPTLDVSKIDVRIMELQDKPTINKAKARFY